MRARVVCALAAAVALFAAGAAGVSAAAAPGSPPQETTVGVGSPQSGFPSAFAQSLATPDLAPAGSNDWSCRPTAAHPRPVVLVHGTWENAYDNWAEMSPALAQSGYCVFALNYGAEASGWGPYIPGAYATGDIAASARELATYVDAVLAATGAGQVDLVGHSQGGLMARQYLRFAGGADPADPSRNKVHTLVTLGATNHGTTLDGIALLGRQIQNLGVDILGVAQLPVGVAGVQQTVDSPFVLALNAGGDTVPGVSYTVIATRYDEVTTPYTSTFLTAGPGATVHNITLQDGCDADYSDHPSMPYSPRAVFYVRQALDPATLAGQSAPCAFNPPIL